ncbi:MucBP domain-containing protein [Enterococcus entomosocium]|uniref:MucBP domain-containing protein n=1 Tax=Enterococcus entomosocium TaxID=3034352 RepID=UPI003BDC0783
MAKTPTNTSGTFSDTAQEVVYVYERSDAITVKYQDSEGNQLADPTVLSGKVGLPYTSEAKEIPGGMCSKTQIMLQAPSVIQRKKWCTYMNAAMQHQSR